MGCFDVACGLTGFTICNGEEAGGVLLRRPPSYDFGFAPDESCYTDVAALWQPVLPPFYGTYDDYGSLEDVEGSTTQRVFEELIGFSIENIARYASNGHGIYHTFEKRSAPVLTEFGYGKIEDGPFAELGFTVTETDVGTLYGFGNCAIRHENDVWSVERNGRVHKPMYLDSSMCNLLEGFSEFTGHFPGFPKRIHLGLKMLQPLKLMLFHTEIFENLRALPVGGWEQQSHDKFVAETESYLESLRTSAGNDDDPAELFEPSETVNTRTFIDKAYITADLIPHLHPFGKTEEFYGLYQLSVAMKQMNRIYMPSVYAGQGKHTTPAKVVAETILRLTAKREADADQ